MHHSATQRYYDNTTVLLVAMEFNSYFSSIGNMLQDELNRTYPDGISTDLINYCDKPVKDSMFVRPVNPVEQQYLVNGLSKNKSPGFDDNIGPSLVKLVFPVICHTLTHIYNLYVVVKCKKSLTLPK